MATKTRKRAEPKAARRKRKRESAATPSLDALSERKIPFAIVSYHSRDENEAGGQAQPDDEGRRDHSDSWKEEDVRVAASAMRAGYAIKVPCDEAHAVPIATNIGQMVSLDVAAFYDITGCSLIVVALPMADSPVRLSLDALGKTAWNDVGNYLSHPEMVRATSGDGVDDSD